MMRFLDANIFVYAFYKAKKKKLDPMARAMKDLAKDIIRRISRGEENVITSVVHLSEICNIVKHSLPVIDVLALANSIITSKQIKVLDVTSEIYKEAISVGLNYKLTPNDALAVLLMKKLNINEIYTFDKDFDTVDWISRYPTKSQIKRKIEKSRHST